MKKNISTPVYMQTLSYSAVTQFSITVVFLRTRAMCSGLAVVVLSMRAMGASATCEREAIGNHRIINLASKSSQISNKVSSKK
jgi:hypothetical protein